MCSGLHSLTWKSSLIYFFYSGSPGQTQVKTGTHWRACANISTSLWLDYLLMAVFALLSFSFSLFWYWEESLQNIFTYSPKHQSQQCRQFQDVNNILLLRYLKLLFKFIFNPKQRTAKNFAVSILWPYPCHWSLQPPTFDLTRDPILLLEGHFPAEFCSSTLAWMLLLILKTLAGWFRCV